MMRWLHDTFQTYPELAVFLALCIGFYVGKLKFRGSSLGTVASTLLAGMLIGQMHISISPHVQGIFFVMFLFAVGYNAGPGFFSSLGKGGLIHTFFSIVVCVVSILTAFAIALVMHYDKGQAAGLFGGSQTASPIIGVASNTISQLSNISDAEKQRLINEIPVCFAITYIFGTAGSTWLLTTIGPLLLGGVNKVKSECRQLEDKMSDAHHGPALTPSNSSFNAFLVTEGSMAQDKTVRELEEEFITHDHRIFIRRIRRGGTIIEATPELRIQEGDIIAVNGRRSFVLPELHIGTEVIDEELLSFPIVIVPVYAINEQSTNLTVKDLALKDYMYGVIIQSITRSGTPVPMYLELKIEKGDQLELMGLKNDIDRAIPEVGYAEVATNKTNMVFMGLGIVLGGLLGAFTFQLGAVPFSFSSTGVLFSGLFFGWLRAQKPTFGKIPEATLWLMENVGLAVFVAIVGINAGPGFVAGVKIMGITLFVAGMVASALPIFAGLLIGRYLFKLHPAYTLGCIAGVTASSALSGIQDTLQSNLPTLGYTVAYAINNTVLIIGAIVLILLV